MDNIRDSINLKMLTPLGRIPAAVAMAFGPALEKTLNAAAPLFNRLAKSFEEFAKGSLPRAFENLFRIIAGLGQVIPVVGGVMAGMFAASVVGKIVLGITTITKALKTLRAAMSITAITEVVTEAVATKGLSVVGAGAGLVAGLLAANQLKNILVGLEAPATAEERSPYVPGDVLAGFGSKPFSLVGELESTRDLMIDALRQKGEERFREQDKLLSLIEKNTAKTADLISARRATGGGELARMGISGAEIRKLSANRNGALYGRA